jgi:hypothetical protein
MHDQKTHGSWADGSIRSELTDNEFRDILYTSETVAGAYKTIAAKLGKDMKAQVADLSEGEINVYRGVRGVERDMKNLTDGNIRYTDMQTWGQGIYVTPQTSFAENYGTVVGLKLSDGANILRGESAWADGFTIEWENPRARKPGSATSSMVDLDRITMDHSMSDVRNLYYASQGYDGFQPFPYETVLFNGGVLTVDSKNISGDVFKHQAGIVPENTVIRFAPGLVPVLKHAMHDQKTHGSWARSMRGYEERTASGRGQRSGSSDESPSTQARREALENVDYIMGRTTRAPSWTGPSDPLYVPARSLGDRVQSARRKIAAWKQSRDRRSMERMTSAELETLGAKNRERARRKREKLGLPPFVAKSFDPVYEILQRIFVDVVEPSLWVELVEDPRSLVDLTGPLGDLVDDMLDAVAPQKTVIKFAPGLRPVVKHQSGKHEQSSHGNWADSGSPKLKIMGQNDGSNSYFNEKTRVVRYQPDGKEPTDYVLYASEDFVVSMVKPTDGTTINGYSEGGTNKGEVGHLDITGAGSNPWRDSAKDDNKATITEVVVRKAHQRRGLASAMLRFHRDMYPELDVQHSDLLLSEGKAWAEVVKHQAGKHDQKLHGSWADSGGGQAGMQKAADMWIGNTDGFSYQMVNEIRGTTRVLTGDSDYYPKDDSKGDPTEVFDSTKTLLLEISEASPSEVPLYRGLALQDENDLVTLLKKGSEFEELLASWTPDQKIADDFAKGRFSDSRRYSPQASVTLRVEKLPSVQMMQHYSGRKSGLIGQADERVASGKYRVENVTTLGQNQFVVDVSFQGLPFDPEIVRNTEYTGGRSSFNPRVSAIVRKSVESDLAARMSLDIDMSVVKHQAGKHDQKTHGVWASGTGSSSAASRAREAALTGEPTGLTEEDLRDMRNNPASYGLVMTENDETSQRLAGFLIPNEDVAARGRVKIIEDGFLIREKRQEMAQEALDYMHPDQIKNATALYDMARTEGKVMVAASVKAAEKIMESGRFQTLFETKTSGGSVNFDARLREEFASHDLHPNTTGDKRPVYGYVAFDKPNVGSVWQYGETYFELKPEVKSRTTMTDGDSLGSRATPVPMTGPSLTPIEVAGVSLGWNPMSERAYGDLRTSELPRTIYDNYSDESYFETQIKGGVTLSDVKRIHIPNLFDFDGIPVVNTESYRKLLEVAEERGIEVVKYGTLR